MTTPTASTASVSVALLIALATAACGSTVRGSDQEGSRGATGADTSRAFPSPGAGAPTDGPSERAGETRTGCQKMDIVFVVDNSGSMAQEQANLALNFPKFAQELEAYATPSGAPLDYRLAVATTDTITDRGAFRKTGTHCAAGPDRPWLERGDADLTSAFGCRATVGTHGDSHERPLHSLSLALTDRIQDGTNTWQGVPFLRSDAVLAFVILTDEDEGGSENAMQGTIPGYVQRFDQLKGTRGQWASALIAGLTACSTPQFGTAAEATRLKDFIGQAGGSGAAMSICTGDLAGGLKLALDEFMSACDGW